MRPVLFDLFGLPVHSYGVSKALAALVAGWLLAREFRGHGWDGGKAWDLVIYSTTMGFVGGKLYFLAENVDDLQWHHLGSSGFTWYGGFLAGTVTALVIARRNALPLSTLAGMSAVPLSLAYGIGRLGCFVAGDGTYGRPTDLPWGMAFPNGEVPTSVPVHPTGLYEAFAAFALAALLWRLRRRVPPLTLFGIYAVAAGAIRVLVELVRINDNVVLGLTQPQIWSIGLAAVGVVCIVRGRRGAGDTGGFVTPVEGPRSGTPALS